MAAFSLSFTPASLSEIARLYGFPVYMSEEVQVAMQEGGQLLVQAAQDNMDWMQPTGALEDSMQIMSQSPYELEVGSPLPYSRRREFGFSGMVDSLGRYYPHDPGAYYLEAAAYQEGQNVLVLIEEAAQRAWARIGGA